MNRGSMLVIIGLFCLAPSGRAADEIPELLAAFDPEVDSIQLEFENQVEVGCLLSPYLARDEVRAELQRLGYRVSKSSRYVFSMISWGIATDDYHCSVVLESDFRRYGVRLRIPDKPEFGADLAAWSTSDLLTGPKIHLQERLLDKSLYHVNEFHVALLKARD
jgi:hypothetical protein